MDFTAQSDFPIREYFFFGNQENAEINIREYVRPRQKAKICIREYKLGYSMWHYCSHQH
jgi:hypothetical protein